MSSPRRCRYLFEISSSTSTFGTTCSLVLPEIQVEIVRSPFEGSIASWWLLHLLRGAVNLVENLVHHAQTIRFPNPCIDFQWSRQQPPILLHPDRRSCQGSGGQPAFPPIANSSVGSAECIVVLQEGSWIHKSPKKEGEEDQE